MNSDIVTLQIGVNNVGFFDLFNARIIKLLSQAQTCLEQFTTSRNNSIKISPPPLTAISKLSWIRLAV